MLPGKTLGNTFPTIPLAEASLAQGKTNPLLCVADQPIARLKLAALFGSRTEILSVAPAIKRRREGNEPQGRSCAIVPTAVRQQNDQLRENA